MTELECNNCGNKFDGANGHFIIGEARLCSAKCDAEYKDYLNGTKKELTKPQYQPPQSTSIPEPKPNGSSTEEIREAMNKEIAHTSESFNLTGLIVGSSKEQILKRIEWLNERCAFLESRARESKARAQANRKMYTEELEHLDEETRNSVRTNWEKAISKSNKATAKAEYKAELNKAIKTVTDTEKEINRSVKLLISSGIVPSLAPNGPNIETWTEESARQYIIERRKLKGLPT